MGELLRFRVGERDVGSKRVDMAAMRLDGHRAATASV
jgi:hypothetical protein